MFASRDQPRYEHIMKNTLRCHLGRLRLFSLLTLLAATSLQSPSMATAEHEHHGLQSPSSSPWGGSDRPWESQSAHSCRPNANAGYPGSDLPPSDYNPDAPRYSSPKIAPMPPLDGGLYSGQTFVDAEREDGVFQAGLCGEGALSVNC